MVQGQPKSTGGGGELLAAIRSAGKKRTQKPVVKEEASNALGRRNVAQGTVKGPAKVDPTQCECDGREEVGWEAPRSSFREVLLLQQSNEGNAVGGGRRQWSGKRRGREPGRCRKEFRGLELVRCCPAYAENAGGTA